MSIEQNFQGKFGFEEKTVQIEGRRISYLEKGFGKEVILLPGWPLSTFMFAKILPHFKNDHYHLMGLNYLG